MSVFWLVQASRSSVFFVPFAWPLVGLWAVAHFARAIGLTLTFHRYFAHRAFKMGRVTQFVWALIGTSAMQKGPLWWAGHHVTHHKYADRDGDPHSPHVSGFYYAHVGWFLNDVQCDTIEPTNPVVRDFGKFPELVWLEQVPLRAAGGAGRSMYLYRWLAVAGVGLLLPTFTLSHSTFAINTVNHLFGSRRFRTVDESRNNAADRDLRGRRGVAQQPPPLSALRAQRLLLVGDRSDLLRDCRDGLAGPGLGHPAGAGAHLPRGRGADARGARARPRSVVG